MVKALKRHLILGLGSIGKRHAAILGKAGCDVAGVDPFSPGGHDILTYPSLEEGWGFNPDMVWICSPTRHHADQALAVMEKGVPVFIEKPVAHSLYHAKRLLAFHEKQREKQLVWVGCNMRFHPAVCELKKHFESGIIGDLLILKMHFSHWLPNMRPGVDYRDTYAASRDGGGVLLDNIHDIDLALHFAGPAKSVEGVCQKSGVLDISAEDFAGIHLVHENQTFTQIQMDFLRKDKSRGIEMIGEHGSLEWRSRGKNPELATVKFYSEDNTVSTLYEERLLSFDAMFQAQYDHVVDRHLKGSGNGISLGEAYSALEIVSQLKQ